MRRKRLQVYIEKRRLSIGALVAALLAILFLVLIIYRSQNSDIRAVEIDAELQDSKGLRATSHKIVGAKIGAEYAGGSSDRLNIRISVIPMTGAGPEVKVVLRVPSFLERSATDENQGDFELEDDREIEGDVGIYRYVSKSSNERLYLDETFSGRVFNERRGEFGLRYSFVSRPTDYDGTSRLYVSGLLNSELTRVYPEPSDNYLGNLVFERALNDHSRAFVIIEGTDRKTAASNEFTVFMLGIMIGIATSVAVEVLVDLMRFLEIDETE